MKIILDVQTQELKVIFVKEEYRKKETTLNTEEYIFIPIVDEVEYRYNGKTLTLNKNGKSIDINVSNNKKHITKIDYNKHNKIDINNVVVLTGYAIDKDNLGLIQTLNPCNHVKGILINGEIKSLPSDLSKQEITFSKDSLMDKLYFLRRSTIEFENDIKINLITTSKLIRETNYHYLRNADKEKIKEKMKGIIDLYGISNNEEINNIIDILIDVIQYHSI